MWIQFRKHYGLNELSTLALVVKNHLFPPSLSDSTFTIWRNKGLLHVKHLYKDNIFTNFTELAARFELPHSHFFRFLQARHFVKTNYPHFPNHPPGSLIDTLLTLDPVQKRSISVIYNAIDSLNPDPTTRLKQTWEEELGAPISDNQWDQILKLVHTSSICARHSLLQCKVIFRVHYTNARLVKIYPGISDSCNRCKQSPANHTHMFWSSLSQQCLIWTLTLSLAWPCLAPLHLLHLNSLHQSAGYWPLQLYWSDVLFCLNGNLFFHLHTIAGLERS